MRTLFQSILVAGTRDLLLLAHKVIPGIRKIWRYKGVWLYLPKGVFNPIYTLSTSILLDVLKPNKTRLLDLYTGSGIIPISAEKRGATLTVGYDKNMTAIVVARVNANLNGTHTFFTDNLDEALERRPYDIVTANPPYLPCRSSDPMDINWCAEDPLNFLNETIEITKYALKDHGRLLLVLSTLSGISPKRAADILSRKGFSTVETYTGFTTPVEKLFVVRGHM